MPIAESRTIISSSRAEESSEANPAHSWRPLYLLNLYRLVLASIMLSLVWLDAIPTGIGKHNPTLFAAAASAYLGIAVVSVFTIWWRRPMFLTQVFIQVTADIILIVLLMSASGSIQSGLGILLVVAIAGGSLLIARKRAILFAAAASILLLLEQTYVFLYSDDISPHYLQAGLLGGTLFATATAAQWLARRVRESEDLARRRGADLANLEQLTEYVVQRMQTGIVVVNAAGRVGLINDSAWSLLGMPMAPSARNLSELSPSLFAKWQEWQRDARRVQSAFTAVPSGPDLMPRFARLGREMSAGTLIFLEDVAATAQQAQQLKLASLGRLTASIAHEIRNPLGAISHAGQLLSESPRVDVADARLIEIILTNSVRVNAIIENILQLSRRQRAKPEDIELSSRLAAFVDEFSHAMKLDTRAIDYDLDAARTMVRFDPSQLNQVLWNLCQNGLRYTRPQANGAMLRLDIGRVGDQSYLDVIDFGPGVESSNVEQIFEPFFTTETKGTGLGLYIARELCESNQARLSYLPIDGGCCFRIMFADIRRSHVA